jgi:hypothetical protein
MDITDYLVWKFVALVALAFAYGLWKGLNGRRLEEPLDKPPQGPDQQGTPGR